MVKVASAAALALAVGACAPSAARHAPAEPVEVSPGPWMIPVGARPDGCPMFTQRSDRFPVNRAIYFRQPEGGFTPILEWSECSTATTETKQ